MNTHMREALESDAHKAVSYRIASWTDAPRGADAGTVAMAGMLTIVGRRNVTALMVNPFVKVGGLELFGVGERSAGRNSVAETGERSWNQYVVDAVYRFLPGERVYAGARYNTARGDLLFGTGATAAASEVSVDRAQFGGGWLVNRNILVKGEYVTQKYNDFPTTDIRSGGKFRGFVVEGVVAF